MEVQVIERKLEKIVSRMRALGFLLTNQDLGLTEETAALVGLGGLVSDLTESLDELVCQLNAARHPVEENS